ncbi:MAG: hypothetical protein ABS46_17390 [Cytophagaceae bacterium SCN 52-12]|nr:MAG: hypothetical protein ABS46_17390 [Cytophagaceae bacterium SCN 52-12]
MTGQPDPVTYLFVYGTLKSSFPNSFSEQLRNSSAYIGEGTFPGLLYLVSWFPAALYVPGSSRSVHGEIYRMEEPGRLLPILDEYEDIHPDPDLSLYTRKMVPVLAADNRIFNCWTYLYNRSAEGLRPLCSGKFSGPE